MVLLCCLGWCHEQNVLRLELLGSSDSHVSVSQVTGITGVATMAGWGVLMGASRAL
jgi:hypothetical protein